MAQFSFLKSRSAILLTAFLVLQCALFYGFSRGEPVPIVRPLEQFPTQLGAWHMVQQGAMEQDVKDVLRADDYVNREYGAAGGKDANLFVAFFKSQRTGQAPHSPKNCLPGAGWIWTVSDTVTVPIEGRPPVEINRYIVSRGEFRSMVLYWYQSRDRVVASEYKAAAFVAWDAMRYNRTDTALVRVVVPITNDSTEAAATETGVEFVQSFFNTLRRFFPA